METRSMIRLLSGAVAIMWLCPSWLHAQGTVLTVTVASADVYKSPSTGSPIIGHAPRGAALQVTRELGSWVKIAWAAAPDGVGYVHVTMGSVSHRSAPDQSWADSGSPNASAQLRPQPAQADRARAERSSNLPRPAYVNPATHAVGFGGRAGGSTIGIGASARAWRRDGWGAQLAVSRRTFSGAGSAGDVSSTAIEPGVLYSLRNQVTDYWWMRPYLGSGLSFQRLPGMWPGFTGGLSNATSENHVGLRVFAGGELTFAGVPRFALGADVGYLWVQTRSIPVQLGGFGVALSGHWYVK